MGYRSITIHYDNEENKEMETLPREIIKVTREFQTEGQKESTPQQIDKATTDYTE